jgi:hypothetical protein
MKNFFKPNKTKFVIVGIFIVFLIVSNSFLFSQLQVATGYGEMNKGPSHGIAETYIFPIISRVNQVTRILPTLYSIAIDSMYPGCPGCEYFRAPDVPFLRMTEKIVEIVLYIFNIYLWACILEFVIVKVSIKSIKRNEQHI